MADRLDVVGELLEDVLFADPDPRVQRIKAYWEEARREADALLAAACEENYQDRLRYHRTCGERHPEHLARADASALRQLCMEEYDQRLSTIWDDVQRRLAAVMAELTAERGGE